MQQTECQFVGVGIAKAKLSISIEGQPERCEAGNDERSITTWLA